MYLIIGGSSDLAFKITKTLVKYDDVLITYRSTSKLKKIKIKNKNKIFYKKLDLDNLENIKSFVKNNKKLLKKIKFINLATLTSDKLIHNLDIKDLNSVFNVNIFSNILLAKEMLPIMINQNYGKFIFFTSTRGKRGDKGISLYASSKEALSSFSKCLAKEYAGFNISSNCIKLGYFNTKLFNKISNSVKIKLINEIPNKKLGNPNDIIKAILMLSETSYITGSDVTIDGGI